MKLQLLYEKIYAKFYAVPFFKKIMDIPPIKKLLQYEIMSYLVFGVLTSVVNFIVYGIMGKIGGVDYESRVLAEIFGFALKYVYLANAVAWIASVLFSFVTNKLFVFESTSFKANVFFKEIFSFVGARIISFLLFEELLFGILLKVLPDVKGVSWIAKIVIGVFVVVFNYVASKLVIFRKKKTGEEEK